jgi:predicted N-acetyltransferase YhbS
MIVAPARHAPREASWRIEIEAPADASAVEALVLAAFGPGRFAKTAERLRERARVAVGLVAREDV